VSAILITGGAGFIGSHVVRLFVRNYPNITIINFDKLTYAGNLANVSDLQENPNYHFIKGDISDKNLLRSVFEKWRPFAVIHLAAESHVDRSIQEPETFLLTNIMGTAALLDVSLDFWKNDFSDKVFYHISTDEVYGSLGESGVFSETSPYDPQSPYAASKAASDHLVRAYGNTYQFPFLISNCSNNYGPNQFPEKLIPLCINNLRHRKPVPVYGKGENVRDWLYVKDHAEAILSIFEKGRRGETYLIGGRNERKNIDLVRTLCRIYDDINPYGHNNSESLIHFVKDRPGHDHRYAIDPTKLEREIGWRATTLLENGLRQTIVWYLENTKWLEEITSGTYIEYYKRMYELR